ncbi:hypothetical protein [Deinococcus cellulosilyticus]|uniref:hypothetical protein n=1 Tax=Deinococcus cellulosilyticus TaxID=401558 RepID=UPI0011BF6C0F|nr:hypothetical protein [Deinococcus cellulosilyticus]
MVPLQCSKWETCSTGQTDSRKVVFPAGESVGRVRTKRATRRGLGPFLEFNLRLAVRITEKAILSRKFLIDEFFEKMNQDLPNQTYNSQIVILENLQIFKD